MGQAAIIVHPINNRNVVIRVNSCRLLDEGNIDHECNIPSNIVRILMRQVSKIVKRST